MRFTASHVFFFLIRNRESLLTFSRFYSVSRSFAKRMSYKNFSVASKQICIRSCLQFIYNLSPFCRNSKISLNSSCKFKLTDLVTLYNALLMYNYHHNLLPSSFENFFKTVASIHSYNTRLASKSTYYLNTIKTNYGKFNFRFAAVKVWNNLDESIKHLPLKSFKNKVMLNILQSYCSWVFFFSFSFFSFYLFTNSLFVLALVPTYLLCLNII